MKYVGHFTIIICYVLIFGTGTSEVIGHLNMPQIHWASKYYTTFINKCCGFKQSSWSQVARQPSRPYLYMYLLLTLMFFFTFIFSILHIQVDVLLLLLPLLPLFSQDNIHY